MKKLVLLSIFISTTLSAQFFESNEPYYEREESYAHYSFFDEPEYETENIPDPFPSDEDDPVPINHWQFLLSGMGVAIAILFLRKQKILT